MAAEQASFHVSVGRLGGKTVKLELEPSCSVRRLRRYIFDHWTVLPEFQRIVLGNQKLRKSDIIATACSGETDVHLTLLVSLSVLRRVLRRRDPEANLHYRLQSHSWRTQDHLSVPTGSSGWLRALAMARSEKEYLLCGLALLGHPEIDEEAVASVIEVLSHGSSDEMVCALQVLLDLGQEDNAKFIDAVVKLLSDKVARNRDDQKVKLQAVVAMGKLALDPCLSVVVLMQFILNNDENDTFFQPCIETAISALVQVSERSGGGDVIAMLLEHDHVSARLAAVQALSKVLTQGDACAIAAVTARLRDVDAAAQLAALKGAANVILDSSLLVTALLPLLACKSNREPYRTSRTWQAYCGRSQALHELARIASNTDGIDAMVGLLDHSDAWVRLAPLQLLTLSGEGDADASVRARAKLMDSDARASGGVSVGRGNEQVIARVTKHLDDSFDLVRQTATKALVQLYNEDDPRLQKMLAARLRHPDARDRDVAETLLRAVPLVSENGDDQLLSAVLAQLQHKDASVRMQALTTLTLAEFGNGSQRIISAATYHAQKDKPCVQTVAQHLLRHCLSTGNRTTCPQDLPKSQWKVMGKSKGKGKPKAKGYCEVVS